MTDQQRAEEGQAMHRAGYEDGFKRGAEAMQSVILELMHEEGVSDRVIALVVQLPYPEQVEQGSRP